MLLSWIGLYCWQPRTLVFGYALVFVLDKGLAFQGDHLHKSMSSSSCDVLSGFVFMTVTLDAVL